MLTPDLRATAEALVARYPVGRSALLPLLHLVQSQEGYVNEDGIAECAQLLGLTKAEVGAVATFYTMYKRAPMGRHLVSVCTNFSCKVRGGQEVYERLSQRLGVGHNGTTDDGAITLEHAECLGNCEGAPVVTVDYLNYECLSPDDAEALVAAVAKGEVPRPTRGFPSAGIRQTSHRLAGAGPLDTDPEGRSSLVDTAGASAPPPTATEPAPAAAEAPEERTEEGTEDRAEAPGQDADGDKGLVTEAKELVSAAREHLPSWMGGSSHTEPDRGEETAVSPAPEGGQGAERQAEAHAAEVDVERSTGADSDEVESESGYSSREMPTTAHDSDDDYPAGDPRGDDLEPAQPAGDRDRSRLLGPDGPESEPRSDELGDKSDPGNEPAADPGSDTPTDPGAPDRG